MSMTGTAKPISVNFTTTIKDGRRSEKVSFEAIGQYYLKSGATYLRFDENSDAGIVPTTVKIKDQEVVIIRSGPVAMRHSFILGEETVGVLTNPLGTFQMNTTTKAMTFSQPRGGAEGDLQLTYDLILHDQKAGRYQISLRFREVH